MATQTITPSAPTIAAFGAGEIIYFTGGGYNVTATVDQSGQTQAAICEVSDDFTGDLATAAAPFQQSFSTRLVYAAQSGTMYWESDASDVDTTALAQCIGGGHLVAQTTGTITRAECARGTFTVNSAVVVTTGRNSGGRLNLYDAGGASAVTTLDQLGGFTYCQRPITTGNVMGGTLLVDSDDADATNALTTLNIYGGELILRDPGTIGTFSWYGGNVRYGSKRPLTISGNVIINMTLPGAQAFLDNPLLTISGTTTRIITDGRPLA